MTAVDPPTNTNTTTLINNTKLAANPQHQVSLHVKMKILQ